MITGAEEAELSFHGAVNEFDYTAGLSWSWTWVAGPQRSWWATIGFPRVSRPTSGVSG
ncbi:putative exopolyphosphatase [Mycobacterium xenopi 3993]|nr:putative exopolyphosphatase [Mycobacterium xenopi 3993]